MGEVARAKNGGPLSLVGVAHLVESGQHEQVTEALKILEVRAPVVEAYLNRSRGTVVGQSDAAASGSERS